MPFDTLIGKQIGDFLIEERIGMGAMATVYRAYQASISRHVALKVIRLDEGQGQQEEFRRRFAREAEVIAKLEHIHILPIYAYGIYEEMAYLAMRLLRGGSLSELIRKGDLTLERTAEIFKQVAKGLTHAHNKGVIHRDLKPSNIMLDETGNAYLTDFGLAKLSESSAEITKTGTIVGTPAYMSPEQLRGDPLDRRSDIYSLAVILYNMVVGRLPFDTSSSDLVSIIYQHLEKPPIPPREINPQIPPEVEEVILRGLQKDRDKRYDSALDMARALDAALGRLPGSSNSLRLVLSSQRIAVSRQRRRFGLAALIGIFALLAALTFAVTQIAQRSAEANATATEAAAVALADAAASQAAALGASQTADAELWTPTPLPIPQVIEGQRQDGAKALPSTAEIAAARSRLRRDGFIAYIACTLDTEYHSAVARTLRDFADQYQLALRVYDSKADSYNQITQINRARSEGASALIICPVAVDALDETLAAAQAQRVPLVFQADKLPENFGGVQVAGDNYEIGIAPGQAAGQYIVSERAGRARVIILDYPDLLDIVQRAQGLEDGMKQIAPEAEIVGRYLGGTRENGRQSVEKLIADGVAFDVILSINDAGAFGAIEAMDAAGFDPSSVAVFSVDAETLAQQYIRDGFFMRGSLTIPRELVSQTLLNTMVKLLAGSPVPEYVVIPLGAVLTRDRAAASGS
jgi:ABC-type sugar transport system substrate-binding protein/tRNA A-37 threonylcarbamoyl transferase component Bud32